MGGAPPALGAEDETVTALLHGHGLRRTSQRLAVIDALAGGDGFLRPAEVYDELLRRHARVDRATVYRTLSTMVNLGVVRTIVQPPGLIAYGLAAQSPSQVVCTSCGAAVELSGETLARVIAEVGAASGLAPAEVTVTIHGICADCRRA